MKTSILFFCFVILSLSVRAQKDSLKVKQELSLIITDVIDAGFLPKYERKVFNQFSLVLGAGYKGKNGLIDISGLNTPTVRTSRIRYSGFKLLFEARYYLSKTQQMSLDGFYLGLYSKNSFYSSSITGTYKGKDADQQVIDIGYDIRINSIGMAFGYKLPVTRRITLDFLIAGPGVAYYHIGLKPRITLPDQFYADLNSALSSFSVFDATDPDFDFTFTDTSIRIKTVSFRYGISLGFRF